MGAGAESQTATCSKTLNLKADSSGYLNGQLTGELQPLADNLPAKVRITADGFRAPVPTCRTPLQLNQLELTGDGDLKNGYQLLGKATLPAEQGRSRCCCKARSNAKGAQIAGLDLTANDKQSLKLSGTLGLEQRPERRRENRLAGFPVAPPLSADRRAGSGVAQLQR